MSAAIPVELWPAVREVIALDDHLARVQLWRQRRWSVVLRALSELTITSLMSSCGMRWRYLRPWMCTPNKIRRRVHTTDA